MINFFKNLFNVTEISNRETISGFKYEELFKEEKVLEPYDQIKSFNDEILENRKLIGINAQKIKELCRKRENADSQSAKELTIEIKDLEKENSITQSSIEKKLADKYLFISKKNLPLKEIKFGENLSEVENYGSKLKETKANLKKELENVDLQLKNTQESKDKSELLNIKKALGTKIKFVNQEIIFLEKFLGKVTLTDLPREIIEHNVLSYVDKKDLVNISLTVKNDEVFEDLRNKTLPNIRDELDKKLRSESKERIQNVIKQLSTGDFDEVKILEEIKKIHPDDINNKFDFRDSSDTWGDRKFNATLLYFIACTEQSEKLDVEKAIKILMEKGANPNVGCKKDGALGGKVDAGTPFERALKPEYKEIMKSYKA